MRVRERVLDDLRGGEVGRLHAGVELRALDADPLLRDHGDDVVPPHHLLALTPQVVHPQLDVRHACSERTSSTDPTTHRSTDDSRWTDSDRRDIKGVSTSW